MPTPEWEIDVTFHVPRTLGLKVKGRDWTAAQGNAQKLADGMAKKIGPGVEASVSIVKQLGEPWLRTFGSGIWYDLHGPGDVICFERSTGNVFTEADVALLKKRIESTGLKVKDSWNGAGCNGVSFRCSGRKPEDAQFTKAQVKAILAPRPKEAVSA